MFKGGNPPELVSEGLLQPGDNIDAVIYFEAYNCHKGITTPNCCIPPMEALFITVFDKVYLCKLIVEVTNPLIVPLFPFERQLASYFTDHREFGASTIRGDVRYTPTYTHKHI